MMKLVDRLITIFGTSFLVFIILFFGVLSEPSIAILIKQTIDGPMIDNGTGLQEIITPYNTDPFAAYNVTGGFKK